MAKMMEPRFKLSRRLGVNIYGHPKAMKRANAESFRGSKKLSNYGAQLLEKQKLRAYYGVLERQFRRYVDKSLKSKGVAGEVLVQLLETRLDNMVYRMGFGKSIREARQMVNHGHILVNGQKVNIPSFALNVGDVVALKDKSKNVSRYVEQFRENNTQLSYINKNTQTLEGKLLAVPSRELIPIEVKEQLVIDFYSR